MYFNSDHLTTLPPDNHEAYIARLRLVRIPTNLTIQAAMADSEPARLHREEISFRSSMANMGKHVPSECTPDHLSPFAVAFCRNRGHRSDMPLLRLSVRWCCLMLVGNVTHCCDKQIGLCMLLSLCCNGR